MEIEEIKESIMQEINTAEYKNEKTAKNVSVDLLKDTLLLINELEKEVENVYLKGRKAGATRFAETVINEMDTKEIQGKICKRFTFCDFDIKELLRSFNS